MKSEILFVYYIACFCIAGCARNYSKQHAREQARMLYNLALAQVQDDSCLKGSSCSGLLNLLDQADEQCALGESAVLRGHILMRLGKFHKAAHFLKRRIEAEPVGFLRAELINSYACVLVELKQSDRALKLWRMLAHDDTYQSPESAWYNSGKVYFMRNNYQAAQSCFNRSLELVPSYAPSHKVLACMYDDQGDEEQAAWHRMVLEHLSSPDRTI